MPGGINRAINNLDSGDCSGETTTEEDFINSIYSGLIESGIDINTAKRMDIVKYLDVLASKAKEKEKKSVSNLLF